MMKTEEIKEAHDNIIEETGGHTGIVNLGNLDFIISQINTTKDIYTKSARALYGIVKNHPFADGNKRTAIAISEAILRENGMKFTATDEALWDIVHNINKEETTFIQVLNWLKKNVGKV
mgnify:CR=1 FL=1